MRRYANGLLIVYVVSVTLLAAKYASQALIYRKTLAHYDLIYGGKSSGSFEQAMGRMGLPNGGWSTDLAKIGGSFDPFSIIVASVVIGISYLSLNLPWRSMRSPGLPPRKD